MNGRSSAWSVCFGLLAGCTVVADEHRFPPNPEKLSIFSTTPPQGATEVSPDVQVDLCVSGLVDPRSVTNADATLSSGLQRYDSILEVQLVPWTGAGGGSLPVDVSEPWCPGSVLSIIPRSILQHGVLHRVRLQPHVMGWRGESFDVEAPGWVENENEGLHFSLEFEVGAPVEGDDPPVEGDDPPTLTDLFAPGAVFDPERQTCGCHLGSDPTAHALLDLRTPASAFAGLVLPTRVRDTGFPMVTPRRPSQSFLLHKLLREDSGQALHGVLGAPMPPESPLSYAELVQIIRWIEAGALP